MGGGEISLAKKDNRIPKKSQQSIQNRTCTFNKKILYCTFNPNILLLARIIPVQHPGFRRRFIRCSLEVVFEGSTAQPQHSEFRHTGIPASGPTQCQKDSLPHSHAPAGPTGLQRARELKEGIPTADCLCSLLHFFFPFLKHKM